MILKKGVLGRIFPGFVLAGVPEYAIRFCGIHASTKQPFQSITMKEFRPFETMQ
jgi:hypothetical protein